MDFPVYQMTECPPLGSTPENSTLDTGRIWPNQVVSVKMIRLFAAFRFVVTTSKFGTQKESLCVTRRTQRISKL